jgi:murein L,D-transpeptidase YcbB/YkuD
MSTVATPAVKTLAADWKKVYPSAKISGICPDRDHEKRGGYHVGRAFQSGSNYSVVRPDDKGGPSDASAAIDMTMNTGDMRLCTSRLVAVYQNPSDPRRKYINAFNGTLNNRTAQRWDVYARKTKSATADHLWHVHLEVRRVYVNSATAMRAILSILRGDSLASYLKSVGAPMVKVASTASTSVLRRNDKQSAANATVKKIQAKLGVGADGFFGAGTEKAVKAFQSKKGLPADGIVGPKTLAALSL